jgi:hypothetical protein
MKGTLRTDGMASLFNGYQSDEYFPVRTPEGLNLYISHRTVEDVMAM